MIFVADACHSGTMYRRGVSRRDLSRGAEGEDRSRRAPRVHAAQAAVSEKVGADDDVTFLAGVSDERLVPEIEIDGDRARRAVLSPSRGRSRARRMPMATGTVTEKELTAFVRTKVQQLTDSQQVPQSFPPVSRAIALFKKPAG